MKLATLLSICMLTFCVGMIAVPKFCEKCAPAPGLSEPRPMSFTWALCDSQSRSLPEPTGLALIAMGVLGFARRKRR